MISTRGIKYTQKQILLRVSLGSTKELPPPLKPRISFVLDSSNFDEFPADRCRFRMGYLFLEDLRVKSRKFYKVN